MLDGKYYLLNNKQLQSKINNALPSWLDGDITDLSKMIANKNPKIHSKKISTTMDQLFQKDINEISYARNHDFEKTYKTSSVLRENNYIFNFDISSKTICFYDEYEYDRNDIEIIDPNLKKYPQNTYKPRFY